MRITSFAAVALLAALPGAARLSAADPQNPVYPVTYATPSPDGRFLFVMLAPPNPDPKQNPDADARARELRAKYPASGMYPADGTAPLWTADWYAYGVFPANDGVHLVREDSAARMLASFVAGHRLPAETVQAQLDGPALSFLEGGKVLKTYTVRQLVEEPDALPQSVTHVLWMAGAVVTADGQRFVVMTQDSQQVIFDLSTGDVVTRRKAGLGNVQVWVVRGLMAVIAAFIVLAFVRYVRDGKAKAA